MGLSPRAVEVFLEEFGELLAILTGEEMDDDEIEATFAIIDEYGNGAITLQELTTWWQRFEEDRYDSNATNPSTDSYSANALSGGSKGEASTTVLGRERYSAPVL